MMKTEDYFALGRAHWRRILDAALSRGGDFADLYFEHRVFHLIDIEEDIIKETAEAITLGLGIRVTRCEKTGYAYVNDLTLSKALAAAAAAAAIADGPQKLRIPRLRPVSPKADVYTSQSPLHEVDLKARIALAQEAYAACLHASPRIKKARTIYQDSIQNILIVNAEGLTARDTRPMVKLACVAIAEKGGKRESGYRGGGGRVGLEYFRDTLTPARHRPGSGPRSASPARGRRRPGRRDARRPGARATAASSSTRPSATSSRPISTARRRRSSGTRWARRSAPTWSRSTTTRPSPSFRGSYNVDDEGTPPRKTLLIEKGVVRGLLQDKLSARLMGARR